MDGIARLLATMHVEGNAGFVPFRVAGAVVGWLRPAFAQALRAWPETFVADADGGIALRPALSTAQDRTRAVDLAVRQLAARGAITGWRDERYVVATGFAAEPLLDIERAAARAFGIASYAVHVNGTTTTADGRAMWIGRRSLGKPIDPGMQDNLIGGGLAAGSSVRETLVKEAWEEAGLTAEQVAGAVPGRLIRIRREVPEGLQVETIFVHDLELPPSVSPRNQDGEVSEFRCLPLAEVIALLEEGERITADASLVILDWLDRHGVLPLPGTPAARAIFAAPAAGRSPTR